MGTMNISLTGDLAEYIEAEVSSGDYASANDVVREALLLMRHEREAEQDKFRILKEAVQAGIDEADRGEFSNKSLDEIFAEVLAGRRE